MIEHLKVPNHKALKEMLFQNLGKINVICGKNNSGKTTVLESIASQHRNIAKPLDALEIEQLYIKLDSFLKMFSEQQRQSLKDRIVTSTTTVTSKKSFWADNELDALKLSVLNEIKTNIEGFAPFLQNALNNFFEDTFKTILLPPKRHLQMIQVIDSQETVQSNGAGILNALFFAKNQDATSALNKNYVSLNKAFTEISAGYSFNIFSVNKNEIGLNFALKEKPFIPAQDCGLGLQDLLVILFFALHSEYKVILIEEPESHLHPEMQKKLLAFLRNNTDKQFFLSTHSNVFLNNAYVDRVFFTSFRDTVIVDDATSKASMLDDLGYSVADNLISDVVILVEGPSDIPVLEEFLIKRGIDKKYNIKMWPLGGDIMDQVDLSVLVQSYSIIAIIDKDPGSDKVRKRFIKNCTTNGIPVHKLQRYAIENYFTVEALRQVLGSQIQADISDINPDKKLEEQIRLNVKKNNRRIARAMSWEDIKDTDLAKFFTKVENLCDKPKPQATELNS